MPGLIDAHWHTILIRPTPEQAIHGDVGFTDVLRGRGSQGDADARLHQRARPRRSELRPQAGHRPRHRRGPADLAVGRDDHRHVGTRRLPHAVRTAARRVAAVVANGTDRRVDGGGLARRRAATGARAADARRQPDQTHGRRRRLVAAQPAGCLGLHARGTEGGGGCGDQLGHLRHGPRLHADGGAPRDRRRREGHRARAPGRRCDGEVHGREGRLAVHAAVPGRRSLALSARLGPVPEEAAGGRRYRGDLRIRAQVRYQDGLRHRHPVL